MRAFATFFLFTLCAHAQRSANQPGKQPVVVLISLDGFAAYNLEDPRLPIPTLRSLMKTGSAARRMTPVNPTVTWPNHTSMVTGVLPAQHGLLYNGAAVRAEGNPAVKVDPAMEKTKMVHAVTLYDLVHQAGMTTAQVDWVAINRAPTITWEFPEIPSPDGAIEREMTSRGLVESVEVADFRKLNILRRDQIWTDAATYILREHKPNLLLFHLHTLDSTQHTYGPKNLAATAAIAFLDSCVARVLDTIKTAGMADRTTVVIVSDHGFKVVEKSIRPAVALASAGLGDQVTVIPEGGTAMLYLDKAKAAALLPPLLPQVQKIFDGVEGIAQVAGPDDFAALGLPDPRQDAQMADIVLVAKSGYAFAGGATGPLVVTNPQKTGSHGYLATDPELDAIFIASGADIKTGVSLERIRNVDVAPTLAHLLGVKFGAIVGTPVSGILK